MKSKKVLASLLAVTMLASVALVGCGSGKDNPKDKGEETTDGGATGEETTGGKDAEQYLNLILAQEPKSIDPSKSTDVYSSQILANTQEALTRIIQDEDGKDKIIPGMAETWEPSKDELTWTFNLRDAKWSDGEPITAEQFEYGIKRTLNKDTASSYAFLLFPIKNAAAYNEGTVGEEEVGVKAVDEKTLEFTLEAPCPYFLDLTYFKVMEPQRKDLIEKHGEKFGSEADTMVFSGPFVMSEWVHNNKVVLTKNENYWDAENVSLETVNMKIILERTAAMQELSNGSLDMAGVSEPDWIKKFDDTGDFDVKKGFDGSATYTFFNQEDKLFSNEKVRKAFTIAADRDGRVKVLRKGLAQSALAWCPPQVQIGGEDYRDKVDSLPVQDLIDENQDPKALLIEGMKELGLGDDPSTITVTYLSSGTDSVSKEYAEYDQQMYESALGINMEIEYVEWAVFQKRTDEMDYQFAAMGWGGDYNDPNTFFDMWVTGANMVPTGWSNSKYDELITKTTQTSDPEERAKLFAEAERILIYEDCVISPDAWRFKNTYVRKYVKNYSAPVFGTVDLKYTYTEGRK